MATLAVLSLPSAALAVLLIEGAAMIVVDVMVATSLQRVLGADVLGRAFGALDALIVAGMLCGMLVAPIVVATFGLTTALLVGGARWRSPAPPSGAATRDRCVGRRVLGPDRTGSPCFDAVDPQWREPGDARASREALTEETSTPACR